MFETPYQTTPCVRFVMDKTHAAIRRLEIEDQLLTLEGSVTGVKAVPPGEQGFPPFGQPITPKQITSLNAPCVIDGRQLFRSDGRPVLQNVVDHAILNADLTTLWLRDGAPFRKDLLNLGAFPIKVFSNWMGNRIALGLSLDFGQASIVKAMICVYYIQMCTPLSDHPTADEVERLIIRASRSIAGVDANTLQNVLGDIPRLTDLKSFVDWVHAKLDTPRAEQLNIGFIYTALGFSWGVQYREMVAIALEYPPTFIALLYSSVNDRGFKKTSLGKVVENLVARRDDRDFIENVNHLIGRR